MDFGFQFAATYIFKQFAFVITVVEHDGKGDVGGSHAIVQNILFSRQNQKLLESQTRSPNWKIFACDGQKVSLITSQPMRNNNINLKIPLELL